MRGVIFSDLHVHPHRFGGEVNGDGVHSRTQDCLDVLEQTKQLAIDTGAAFRIFGGDMTHVRGKIAPSIFNPIMAHYAAAHKGGSKFIDIILDGNHDMENRKAGVSSIEPLKHIDGVVILKGYGAGLLNGPDCSQIYIGWVAYDPDVAVLNQQIEAVCAAKRTAIGIEGRPSVFLIHHGIDGVIEGVPETGFGPGNLPVGDFDYCFAGDYHKHKEVVKGKAWSVGAPLQHNFGDAYQTRGWMAVDFTTKEVVHIENLKAPKFVTVDSKAINGKHFSKMLDPNEIKGNFIRIRAEDDKELNRLESEAMTMGAKAVQREIVKDWEAAKKADVQLTMSTAMMFQTWLDALPADRLGGLKREDIIAANNEILREAGIA